MAIDLGDMPKGTPPTPQQQAQIRSSIGLGSSGSAGFSSLVLTGQSITGTAANSLLDMTTTWNTSGIPSAIKLNVNDVFSSPSSNLLDLQVNGASRFNIQKDGTIIVPNGNYIRTNGAYPNSGIRIGGGGFNEPALSTQWVNSGSTSFSTGRFSAGYSWLAINNTSVFAWGSGQDLGTSVPSIDLILARDATGILAQRNGVNAQAFRVYNTFPGTGNNEYAEIAWSGNIFSVRPAASGSGSIRESVFGSPSSNTYIDANIMYFRTSGSARWAINSTGSFLAVADNNYDIGASGGNRPRNIYAASNILANGSYYTIRDGAIQWATSNADPASGVQLLIRSSPSMVNALCIGGATSAFPAIKRNGAGIDIKLADDSAYANLGAAKLSLSDTWNSNISVTGASGTGTVATITFAAQATAIAIGSTIVVASVNPAGYNGTFIVTASSLTSVSYANATTAAWVSGGNIQQLFTAVKLNVTDTASSANSLLMDLHVGGATRFKINKLGQLDATSGDIVVGGYFGANRGFFVKDILSNQPVSFRVSYYGSAFYGPVGITGTETGAPDVIWMRDGAGILAQRNGLNAQTFRLYNTYTDATTFERLNLKWDTNVLKIGTEKGSVGGAARSMELQTDNVTRLAIGPGADMTTPQITQTGFIYGHGGSISVGVGGWTTGAGVRFGSLGTLAWGGGGANSQGLDLLLSRDGAGILAQSNGANAQESRIYGTYTDSSNYRRLSIKMSTAGVAQIFAEGAGTGASGNVVQIGSGTSTGTTTLDVIARGDTDAIRLYSLNNPAGGSVNPPSISFFRSIGSPSGSARFKIQGYPGSDSDGFIFSSPNSSIEWIAGSTYDSILNIISDVTNNIKFSQQCNFINGAIVVGLDPGASTPPSSGIIRSGQKNNNATDVAGSNITIQAGRGTGANATLGNIIFQTPDTTTSGTSLQNHTTKLQISRSGNVGIGTTAPSTLLHLRGGVSPTIKIEGYDAGATSLYPSISFQSNNNQGNFESAKIEAYGYHPSGSNALSFYINDSSGVLRKMWQLDSSGNLVQNPGNQGGNYSNTGILFSTIGTNGTASRFIQISETASTGHPGEMLKLKAGNANSAATGSFNFGGKIFVYGGKAVSTNATPKNGDVILAHDGTTPIGNVGIGTTAPLAKLQVGDSTGSVPTNTVVAIPGVNPRISFSSNDISLNYGGYIQTSYSGVSFMTLGTRDSSVDTNGLTLKTGNVGIGTTNPIYPLHVLGNNATQPVRIRIENTTGPAIVQVQAASSKVASFSLSNSVVWDAGVDTDQKFKIAGPNGDVGLLSTNTRLTIDSSGNVGIGTTAQTEKLHVAGTIKSGVSGSNNGKLELARSSDGASIGNIGIDAGTNVLNINTGTYGSGHINIQSSAAGAGSHGHIFLNPTNSPGNVGIGTIAPAEKLDVVGNVKVSGHFSAATKSFLIDHPTKAGKKLQYGVVESNQHSVLVRGKTAESIIELPEEWAGLVHEDSVTVQLTPIDSHQSLFVISQDNQKVVVGGSSGQYNYTIYGERKDVDKLVTEI